MKIRRKLVFSMLLAVLAALTIAMSIIFWYSSQQAYQLAIEKAQGHLNAASKELSGFFDTRAAEITVYSRIPLLQNINFDKARPFLLEELERHNGIYEKFIIATPEGYFYHTASEGNPAYGGLISVNDNDPDASLKSVKTRDYWKETVGNNNTSGTAFISDPMISLTTGEKQIVVASTIHHNNQVTGMIGGALSWEIFSEHLSNISTKINSDLEWKIRFMLVSNNGTYWYHWDEKKSVHFDANINGMPLLNTIGENKIITSSILDESDNALKTAGKEMISGLSGHTLFNDDITNKPHALIFTPLSSTNYSIAMTIPEQQLLAPVTALRMLLSITFLVVILFVITASWRLANIITTPLISLSSAARQIHLGKNSRLSIPAGDNEITELANSLSSMVESLTDKSERLKQSEERFSLAMMGSNDGLCDINLSTNECFFSNRCKEIIGENIDCPDITLESWMHHIHHEEQKWVKEKFERFINGKRNTFSLEYRSLHRDGKYRHLLTRVFVVRDPEANTAKRIVGTITDITQVKIKQQKIEALNNKLEKQIDQRTKSLTASNRLLMEEIRDRKETEESLQHHRLLLQKTEYLAHVGGWELTLKNMNLHWTEETFRIHELPRSTQLDLEIAINFFEQSTRHKIKSALQEAIDQKIPFDLVLPLITAKANRIWVRAIGEPIIEDNKLTRIIGSIQNITELKRLEQMKNDFVSTVSHELRTPITSIHGSIKLLLNNVVCEIPDAAKSMLDIAEKNSQRLLTLINDLLDMEKISSGKMTFEIKQHSLDLLINEAIKLNQTYADRFGVIITLQKPIPDCEISVDSTRFLQVMSNLLSNAAKFSPMEGEIIVHTNIISNNQVRISVQDFGNGIPDNFKDKIFSKFSQAEGTHTNQTGGTGLGLSISRAIVERMSGTMNFESAKNEGSTFYFELSATIKANTESTSSAREAEINI
ncbi:MAG: ATP-binding protein [Gammaproteobacteria bacterium]|nr:ATP-binding protein [Gammaproteobacteria bacterium]